MALETNPTGSTNLAEQQCSLWVVAHSSLMASVDSLIDLSALHISSEHRQYIAR